MPQLHDLPPSSLTANPKNPRKLPERDEDLTADQRAALLNLGESMRKKQLQPILIQPSNVVIAGQRRHRAALLVKLPTVQVLKADKELSELEARGWALTENLHREEMTGWETFLGFSDLMCMNSSWQMKDLADFLKLSPSTVTRYLSPSKLSQEWQDKLLAGEVTISHCYSASKADKSKHAGLLALALGGAGREELEKVAKPRAQKPDAVQVQRMKLALPGGVCFTVTAEALSLDDLIDSLAEVQKEAKRAREQGLDAKTFQAVLRDRAKVG